MVSFFSNRAPLLYWNKKSYYKSFSQYLHAQSGSLFHDHIWLNLTRPLTGYEFFENFIEDFDEFSKVKKYPLPPHSTQMKNISESAFKTCLAELLGDTIFMDWGGETSDYFTAHLHLNSSRKSATFLLKGPSRFEPMGLNHLGKNNDQIVRLSHEPAQILIVQHCHDILPAVRETLRAFAVQPSNPRRYCLIDGRDSLRLLYAYDLYNKALLLSKKVEV